MILKTLPRGLFDNSFQADYKSDRGSRNMPDLPKCQHCGEPFTKTFKPGFPGLIAGKMSVFVSI
jgi:hypothetical protein